MMTEFVDGIEDQTKASLLYSAPNGSGAFRRFKDHLLILNHANDWYSFKNERYREIAIEWCQANDLYFIDDCQAITEDNSDSIE